MRACHTNELNRRAQRICLAAAALALFTTSCHRLLETPLWGYNGARLMPSFAMARGLNYYVLLPPGGPLYSSLYGPMAAVTYLPAALFSSPNSAVLAGAAITALLCFLAAAFVHFAGLKPGGKSGDVLAFLALGFLMCFLEPLKYSCFNIHADGPGLALGAFACGALYSSRLKKWRIALPVSALCAVLCVFCKQMFLPLPLVLLLYFWLAEGRRQATRYLLWLAAAGGIAVTAAAMAFGDSNRSIIA